MNFNHKTVDLKQLADWGLIVEINKQILNPLGLMLTYDPITGSSNTVLVADTFKWEYDKETINDAKQRLKEFKKHKKEILKNIPNR